MNQSDATPPLSLYLWQRGFSLTTALQKLTRPELWTEYRASLETPLFPDELGKEDGTAPGISDLQNMLGNMTSVAGRRSTLQTEMRREPCDFLARGDFVAFGYQETRNAHDAPVAVPTDLWSCTPNWSNSSIKGNGIGFTAVRVLTNRWIAELTKQWHGQFLTDPSQKGPGRPSNAPQIWEAYEALKSLGQIDFANSRASACDPIRAWLKAQYPDQAGVLGRLSNETIRQVITEDFKKNQQAKKQ